jgi:hypothetical protein
VNGENSRNFGESYSSNTMYWISLEKFGEVWRSLEKLAKSGQVLCVLGYIIYKLTYNTDYKFKCYTINNFRLYIF